ncbi:MAG: hypothetical protein LW698_06460 [Planctomycetaceae bacterium]|jgi:hypothetical protein|nr:hypothetical protein [Planctomycetaceae bacterium]
MTGTASERSEVWLRSNPRPAVAGAAVAGLAMAMVVAVLWTVGGPGWCWWAVALAAAASVPIVAALVVTASLPRLVRQGNRLRVRLSPLAAEDVPLEIVECVFPGSSPLVGTESAAAPRRVGTVVVRLAERAVDWKERPTFAAWGTWSDGHVVIDGRWCEPLSLEVTKQLGQRILEAKREVAAPARLDAETACR